MTPSPRTYGGIHRVQTLQASSKTRCKAQNTSKSFKWQTVVLGLKLTRANRAPRAAWVICPSSSLISQMNRFREAYFRSSRLYIFAPMISLIFLRGLNLEVLEKF